MRIDRNEIVEQLTGHIRGFGGEANEWWVGTTKDIRTLLPEISGEGRRNADLGDGLAYREAHTPYAADDALDYLVSAFGLRPDRQSAPTAGRIVFVYRRRASGLQPSTPPNRAN